MKSENRWIEPYNGKNIEIIRFNEGRYTYGGFGWSLRIFVPDNEDTLFGVIIECSQASPAEEQEIVLEIGRKIAHDRVDSIAFETGAKYCYNWEPTEGVIEVDCD